MSTTAAAQVFDRGGRTYNVSDERLRAFARLSWSERLRWVEESAQFVRMGQAALKAQRTLPVAEETGLPPLQFKNPSLLEK